MDATEKIIGFCLGRGSRRTLICRGLMSCMHDPLRRDNALCCVRLW